jgi:LysR family transcriptional regulator, carnitine catabolism transcriptional activator
MQQSRSHHSLFATAATTRYFPAFLAVARYQSFTKAARELNLSQPAVTMAVHHLEEAIGVRLFERNTHGVSLTSEGRDLIPTAERLLADLEGAVRKAAVPAEASQKQLRIAAVHSVAAKVLPEAVARFVAVRSDVRIDLHDHSSADVWRRVKSNKADLGFASVTVVDPQLTFTPLFRDQLGLLARTEHALFARPGRIGWDDLAPFEYIRLGGEVASGMIVQMLDLPANIRTPSYEASYNTLLWAMLHEGERVSVVPALFAPDRSASGLAFRPLHEPTVWRTVFAVTPVRRRYPPAVDNVIGLVKSVVAKLAETDPAVECL